MSDDSKTLEAQLRAYREVLDAATEGLAMSATTEPTTLHPRRPFRAALLAAAAVIVAVAIAVGAVELSSHHHSAPPAGPASTTSTTRAGTPHVTVPSVLGEQLTAARRRLERLQLAVVTKPLECTSSPLNSVIAQQPAPGSRVARKTNVLLSVCSGRPPSATETVPVVVCTTVHGVLGGTATAPAHVTIATPPFTSPRLSGYSDDSGRLPITGPAGWGCRALDATDGGTGVEVTPPGVHPTSNCCTDGISTVAASDGVFAAWDPACQGCVYDDICGIAPSADTDFPDFAHAGLCHAPPAGRHVTPLGNDVYVVDDVAGALGPDPARTILKYTPKTATTDASAVREACILPPSQHAVCVALGTEFLALRG